MPRKIMRATSPSFHGEGSVVVYESNITEVLADSGWYDTRTNADCEPGNEFAKRVRFVRATLASTMKGREERGEQHDPMLLVESYCMTTPGGSFSFNGGYTPAKDKTPYLSRMGRILLTAYRMEPYVKGKTLNSHPRFTEVKNCIRKMLKVWDRRDRQLGTAIKRINLKNQYA